MKPLSEAKGKSEATMRKKKFSANQEAQAIYDTIQDVIRDLAKPDAKAVLEIVRGKVECEIETLEDEMEEATS